MKHNQVNKFALCSKAIDTDYIFLNQKLFDKLDLLCAFMRMVALLVFKKKKLLLLLLLLLQLKLKLKLNRPQDFLPCLSRASRTHHSISLRV
jgi:hypothetical protein